VLDRSLKLMSHYSQKFGWVARSLVWDETQAKFGQQARLDEIDRINRDDVRRADHILELVDARIDKAIEALGTRPHALAELVRTATTIRRDAAGITSRIAAWCGPATPASVSEKGAHWRASGMRRSSTN